MILNSFLKNLLSSTHDEDLLTGTPACWCIRKGNADPSTARDAFSVTLAQDDNPGWLMLHRQFLHTSEGRLCETPVKLGSAHERNILILKTKDLAKADPENKELNKVNPENKGLSNFDPENKRLNAIFRSIPQKLRAQFVAAPFES